MPVIEKLRRKGIPGEIIIKFGLKLKVFDIEFSDPTMDKTKINKALLSFKNYEHLEYNLDAIVSQYLSEVVLDKKVIVVKIHTSQSPPVDKNSGIMFDSDEKITFGSGFNLEWWVLEKYKVQETPIYRYREVLYRIIESCPNSRLKPMVKPNILGQIFGSDKVREMEYSDDLYQFLKSMDSQIARLCDTMYKFFDKDETTFLDNIKNQKLLLS